MTRIALVAALAVPCAAVLAAPASADTVVLGSPLVSNYDGGVSTGTNTSVQFSFDPATSTNPVASPANGTITDWKVKSADDGATFTLKVLRPNGPVSIVPGSFTNFTAITSAPGAFAVPNGTFAATPGGVILDNPTSLPISKGDHIGVLSVGGPGAHGLPQAMANGLPQSTFANKFGGQPADGDSADFQADAQHELLLQATVKFCNVPNVLGMPQNAAITEVEKGDCTATVATQNLRLKAIKKGLSKKKKKKIKASNNSLRSQDNKVQSQNPAAGTTAAPGTAVTLTVAKVLPAPKKKGHKKKKK